jgi:FkbM family methyltransferase
LIKATIKKMLSLADLHVQRKSQDPQHTLMGLKNQSISTVLDIGANEGQFARYILRHFPNADIFCFEPLKNPFERLRAWGQSHANVRVYNLALGESEGVSEIFLHRDHTPSSSLLKTTALSHAIYPQTNRQETERITIRRLDSVVTALPNPPKDNVLIKIDVQGFEGHVIRGGRTVFSGAKACVVEICLDDLYEGQGTFKEIFSELDTLSFRYVGNLSQAYADDGHVIYIDALFVH